MLARFKLSGPVGANVRIKKDDTLRTKRALLRLGFLEPSSDGVTSVADDAMIAAIQSFQKENGIAKDGTMKPGGPTERLIQAALFEETDGANDKDRPAFRIGDAVGTGGANRPEDLLKAKRALSLVEIIPADEVNGKMADRTFGGAIEAFQRDFNLKRDGKITPGGETERALARVIRPALGKSGAGREKSAQVAFKEIPENVLRDFGVNAENANPSNPSRSKKTGENKKGSKSAQQTEFSSRAEPTKQPFFDKGTETFRTNGPIKVERWSSALGLDGIHFIVRWHSLDKDGKREGTIRIPKDPREKFGGHTGATGGLKGAADIDPPSDIIEPPFNNPHGWEVDIQIPPQESKSGNSRGAFLRVYLPKGRIKGR